MVSAERAANICQCSRLKIYRWIDEGDLHYVELPDGAVLVCGKTLAHKIEELSVNTDKLNSH
jgi:predicted site-specific integrase-resolvase